MSTEPAVDQPAANAVASASPAACLAASLRCAVPGSGRILLAVSGGSDSMALLALASQLAPARVQVVHVRHGLRLAAEREAHLVRECCAARGIPCSLVEAAPSARDPARTETAARRRRLAALRAAAERAGARWVLLAHHRDDDLETLLLRLQRGHSGDRALAGIPTVRSLGGGVHLLRPFLIGVAPPGRDELSTARQAAGWPHAEDESNADVRIARNRVRANLVRSEPVTPAALLAVRNAARRRLAARLARVTATLALGLRADGHGSRLSLPAPAPGDAAPEDLGELLRLLGGCLQRDRRIDPRAGVLRELTALLGRSEGTLSLPAEPRPLLVRRSREALHFPDEPLCADAAGGEARALHALLRTSLYL